MSDRERIQELEEELELKSELVLNLAHWIDVGELGEFPERHEVARQVRNINKPRPTLIEMEIEPFPNYDIAES